MTTTNYYESVYWIVQQIPYGRVTTYGAIAECLGSKQGARLVGWALNSSRNLPRFLPAHRVVNRNGLLTGKRYFVGNSMVELLQAEGIHIENNQIVDFEKHFWHPHVLF
ncbi:MAG TPA: MGMT family protein [Salinivirgaceae bacterium]|nr:MGMT family protein [Salinivirgaceae bacterium]